MRHPGRKMAALAAFVGRLRRKPRAFQAAGRGFDSLQAHYLNVRVCAYLYRKTLVSQRSETASALSAFRPISWVCMTVHNSRGRELVASRRVTT
jgi:hypothetical protein